MKKSTKKSAKKKSTKKTPIVKLQMRTEKVVSASGKEYYRPIKDGKKSKPAKKTSVKKKSNYSTPLGERMNWNGWNKEYTKLQKEVAQMEKDLLIKKDQLQKIADHLRSLEDLFI